MEVYKGSEQVVSRSDERLPHFSWYTLQIIKAMPSKFLFSVRWQKHIYITLVLGEMLLLMIIIITSSNHRLGSAGLNTLEELLFRCWQ